MTRSIRLRPWQKSALESFVAKDGPDFLAVATPGAGKTTFALTAAVGELAAFDTPRRLIVVAPTAHLKQQWSRAAAALDLHLDPFWSPSDGILPVDMHGIITTYQQVASAAPVLRGLSAGGMVIFDEIHHAGDDRAWGDGVRHAFEGAARRLSLSGTPFRSDTRAIPFVHYDLDLARPDFEYGYGAALADGRVVRPIFFPRTNGHMEWSAPDGSMHAATFDDELDAVRANQRLRTALSLEGEWLPTVLRSAHDRLSDLRLHQPDAGGLVIATDQDHARGIAGQLARRFGVHPVVATSDDPDASARIAAFAESDRPWLVTVRMVSEGVDIPRLRVGVFATTTTTELFFRQAVGRFVRWSRGVPAQRSYLFIPDDARLRARAFQIAELRRHSLRRVRAGTDGLDTDGLDTDGLDTGDRAAVELDGPGTPTRDPEQLSLFAVISAVATATSTHGSTAPGEEDAGWDDDADEDPELTIRLQALPTLAHAGRSAADPTGPATQASTRSQQKKGLRDANAAAARDLVRRTGWSHAQVNAELNRLAGLRRVTEATLDQLAQRLHHAERWSARLGGR